MAVDDDGIELLRVTALDDAGIKALVKRNVYPIQLPQVKDPKYPNISFDIQSGDRVGPVRTFRRLVLAVWAYSNKDYDEAKVVYESFADKFDTERFSDDDIGVNIVLDEIDVPKRFYSERERLFFYRGVWNFTASVRS